MLTDLLQVELNVITDKGLYLNWYGQYCGCAATICGSTEASRLQLTTQLVENQNQNQLYWPRFMHAKQEI